jgi:predicted RNA-binding Zn-ribbon protein involved in translation (DUF1610 family)
MKGTRLQRPDRAQANDLRWKGLLLGVETCARCGGLLIRDEEFPISIDENMPSFRCIQCGEWIDELILLNRVTSSRLKASNHRQV